MDRYIYLGRKFSSYFPEDKVDVVARLEGVHEAGGAEHVQSVGSVGGAQEGARLQVEPCNGRAGAGVLAGPRKAYLWNGGRF